MPGATPCAGGCNTFPGQDQVVIKHPVILRTWLARGEDPEHIVDTLDRHLEATRARLDEALWSRQRSRELGIIDDPDQRFSFAVLDYSIRGLYAELSNIAQLRDEIAHGTTRDPVKRVRRLEGTDAPPHARRWRLIGVGSATLSNFLGVLSTSLSFARASCTRRK